jgi:hypothetical protein
MSALKLLKPLTPMSRSYLFVCRVIPAMLGLGLMNAAIIFLFLGKFPQPGAASDRVAGYGADPDIIPTLYFPIVKNIHPLQNIFPTFGPPAADILRIGRNGVSIQIKAAPAALFAYEIVWWSHAGSFLSGVFWTSR